MRKHLVAIGVLLATPGFLCAQAKVTATQAVLTYTAANSANCTIEVSLSASYSPVILTVDATKFSGANSDGQTNVGVRQFVVGQKWIAQENVAPPSVSVGATAAVFSLHGPANYPPPIVTVAAANSFVIGDNVSVTGMSNSAFNDPWTRIVPPTSGSSFTYELPSNTIATGTSGGGTVTRADRYSLALAANTTYYYRVGGVSNTCGASGTNMPTGTFTTMNLPYNIIWQEGPLQDPTNPLNQLYPTIFENRTTTYNDPFTGTMVKRLALYGDGGVGGGGGLAKPWAVGEPTNIGVCGLIVQNSGYQCWSGTLGFVDTLYYINPTTGETRYLGLMNATFSDSTGHRFVDYISSDSNAVDAVDGNRYYALAHTNNTVIPWKVVLGYVEYTGNDVAASTGGADGANWTVADPGAPWNANGGVMTPLTPDPSGTLTDLMNACVLSNTPAGACKQDSNFSATKFSGCGITEVVGDYIKITCRSNVQDSAAWYFVWKISTSALVAGGPSFANPICRWCGDHTNNTTLSPKWFVTGASINPETQFDVRNVGAILSTDTSWVVTGALDGTSGEPQACGSAACISSPLIDKSTGATWSYMQNVANGDYFMFQDGVGAGTSGGLGEIVRLTTKGSCTATQCTYSVIARGQFGSVASNHAANAVASAFCGEEEINPAQMWWDFIDDPTRSDTTFTYLLGGGQFVSGVHNGHDILASPNFATSPDIFVGGNVTAPVWTGDYTPAVIGHLPDFSIQTEHSFAGLLTDSGGTGADDYNFWDLRNASFKDYSIHSDVFFGGNGFGGGAANITGHIWRWATGFGETLHPELPYYGAQGLTLLKDISGPGSLLPNTGSSQMCVVRVAGECWAASTVGQVYADLPVMDGGIGNQCSRANENAQYVGHDLCVLNPSMYSNSLTQRGLVKGNVVGTDSRGVAKTDAKYSRRLVQTLWGGQRQAGGNGQYLHNVPDGSWMTFESCAAAPHITIDFNNINSPVDQYGCSEYMAQIPPPPSSDGLNRADFLTVPVAIGSVGAGATYAVVEYGYCENEPTRQAIHPCSSTIHYYCTQYQASCFWNGAALTPAYTATSGTHLTLSATANLKIGVPQRAMAYNILYFNGSNAQVGSSGLLWLATDAIAIGGPGVGFSPQPINFGTVTTGSSSSPVSVTVTNTGNSNLLLGANAVSITGTNSGDFSFSFDGCSSHTLTPSATCGLFATFTPTTTGARSANLVVTDVADGISGSDSMTGTGQAPAIPAITFSPNPVTFGIIDVGTSSGNVTVTMINSGNANLVLGAGAVSITGMNPADFSFSSDLCSNQTVGIGLTCTVSARFTPTAAVLRSASLTVTDTMNSVTGNGPMNGTGRAVITPSGTPKGWLP